MCYYGIRSILILYMVGEALQLGDYGAITIYKYLTYFLILTQFIGGIFGDFVLNNKKAILIGGLLAVVGCINTILPSEYLVYLGLALMTFGTGFIKTNILAAFGKTYINHKKYLNTAFSFYYLIVNIGAFIGFSLFAIISTKLGFVVSFGIAAILYVVISLISLAISEGKEKLEYDMQKVSSNSVLYVVVAIFLSALFWGIYELGGTHTSVILSNGDFTGQFGDNISLGFINQLNFYIIVPLLIFGGILWLKFHRSQFLKIAFGFLCMSLAFLQLTNVAMVDVEDSLFHLISSIFFLALAEICIGPMVLSIVTRYTNPKFLTMTMAAYAGISFSIVYMLSPVSDIVYDKSELFTFLGMILAAAITILLFLAVFLRRYYLRNNQNQSSTT
ncbi:glucose-1-phosphate adenylyltransferase [Kordia algicida OT-1]|uniref:Glucose-1-phosphate adenylyltransferase n=2 Tax=Kordia TaxID=221065 RepID=A9E471_9FLAO|nr:glucose-1-phosphate adenylyltransferase [Kordia algicida OT-1]